MSGGGDERRTVNEGPERDGVEGELPLEREGPPATGAEAGGADRGAAPGSARAGADPASSAKAYDGEGATTAQLKDDIDSGRTSDKTGFPDPGAAPLGTGAEAAGTPTSREQLAEARRQERGHGESPKSTTEGRPVAMGHDNQDDPDG